jgi:hypothetical protein
LQRDYAQAAAEAGVALAEFRALGDVEGTAWSLISLGTVARYQGDAERASALLAESLSLAEGIGFREGIAWSAEQLGLLAAADGDPAALGLLRRSLELHSELRDRWRMSSVLEDFAAIALAQDAFLRLSEGKFITLAVPGASMTQALGVNDRDEVVGVYTVGSGANPQMHGFTWRPGHGFSTVDDPHGIGATIINGVNDAGTLVGFYTDAAGDTDGMIALPR